MTIARAPGRTSEEIEHYLGKREPVIFTELARDWRACQTWSLDHLQRNYGDRQVLVASTVAGRLRVSAAGIPQQKMKVTEFLDELAQGKRDHYLITPMRPNLVELLEDLELPRVFNRAAWSDCRFWVGPSDYCTPLHHDLPDNLFVQVFGRKQVILIPKSERRNVYAHGMFSRAPNFSRVDAEEPDLARFPRFSRVTPLHGVVNAGEVLYMPSLWWHQLRSTEVSGSVSLWFANGLKAMVARTAQGYARWRQLRS